MKLQRVLISDFEYKIVYGKVCVCWFSSVCVCVIKLYLCVQDLRNENVTKSIRSRSKLTLSILGIEHKISSQFYTDDFCCCCLSILSYSLYMRFLTLYLRHSWWDKIVRLYNLHGFQALNFNRFREFHSQSQSVYLVHLMLKFPLPNAVTVNFPIILTWIWIEQISIHPVENVRKKYTPPHLPSPFIQYIYIEYN